MIFMTNRLFSREVTAAMLVYLKKEMAAMIVYQTNPPGIELYFYAVTLSIMAAGHVSEMLLMMTLKTFYEFEIRAQPDMFEPLA